MALVHVVAYDVKRHAQLGDIRTFLLMKRKSRHCHSGWPTSVTALQMNMMRLTWLGCSNDRRQKGAQRYENKYVHRKMYNLLG